MIKGDACMNSKISENELNKIIGNLLYLSGIMPNLKGYTYIKEAIAMVYNDQDLLGMLAKIVYPEIGKRHNISSKTVEMRMRAAIKKAWEKFDGNEFYKQVGAEWRGSKEPTNSEYIFLAVEYLNNL